MEPADKLIRVSHSEAVAVDPGDKPIRVSQACEGKRDQKHGFCLASFWVALVFRFGLKQTLHPYLPQAQARYRNLSGFRFRVVGLRV